MWVFFSGKFWGGNWWELTCTAWQTPTENHSLEMPVRQLMMENLWCARHCGVLWDTTIQTAKKWLVPLLREDSKQHLHIHSLPQALLHRYNTLYNDFWLLFSQHFPFPRTVVSINNFLVPSVIGTYARRLKSLSEVFPLLGHYHFADDDHLVILPAPSTLTNPSFLLQLTGPHSLRPPAAPYFTWPFMWIT